MRCRFRMFLEESTTPGLFSDAFLFPFFILPTFSVGLLFARPIYNVQNNAKFSIQMLAL